ncbi:MAG: insulinase family protein [Proteobacteria bacterium]|nr:insulinase family protein [Pseudomonadota bacterium]MBU4286806.1 insulinase family protein [Pseudomonadota bacterium]MBU4414018.1 insulinase family protein [Pseudomonadota bacterium]MCG2757916.1 insulinase family protein [Desulfobacteraceae bacterium]
MDQTVTKTTLNNGIRILSKKIPHARSISMGVWVNVGARDETLSENGLSHFIEHMIFKGTKKRSALQIAKEFDSIGGNTNAFTTMENTCYHAKVMDTHLETMVDILSDIFLYSTFASIEVEKERAVIFQEIGMTEDTPEEYIHILLGNTCWGDNPLGRSILGSRENILSFDSETIRGFFSRLYQPKRILISVAGNMEHDHFVNLVGQQFESINPSDSFPVRVTPTGQSKVVIHSKDLEQVHICMGTKGLSITDPKRYAFSLINTILGGNMSSRLFQEIRENRGLAYSVYSFISSHVDTGMCGVYVGVDPKNAKETIEVILNEIFKLKKIAVDSTELQSAKEYTKGNLMLALESIDSQMVRLAQNEIHFGRHIPLQEVVNKIEEVKVDDIIDLASTLFGDDQIAITLLGPVTDKKLYDDILSIKN